MQGKALQLVPTDHSEWDVAQGDESGWTSETYDPNPHAYLLLIELCPNQVNSVPQQMAHLELNKQRQTLFVDAKF